MKEEFSLNYSLERDTINIFGPIDTRMAERVIGQLQYLDDKFKAENVPLSERIITIQINSPGGSVSDGMAIFDTMNYVEAKIATVGLGMVASMGAFLLAGGTKGLRRATKHCEILIHQPLGSAVGQASDIIIAANHIEQARKMLNGILATNTGQSVRRIEKDTDRDTIMTAEEACRYGLIDSVLKDKEEKYNGKI